MRLIYTEPMPLTIHSIGDIQENITNYIPGKPPPPIPGGI